MHNRSATRLHLVGRLPRQRPPEVLVRRRGRRERRPFATIHTTTWLPEDDLVVVDGIPCTSVARTLFGMAALVPAIPASMVRDLVGEAVRDGKATDAWLWWRLEKLRCRGRNGVAVFEEILSRRADGEVTESWLEREFLALVGAAGLPAPACQQRIEHRGSFVGRVDFLYAAHRVAVEVSGHEHHSSPAQLAHDARRRNELQLAGYLIIEFTYDQVVRDPAYVIDRLREALGISD